MPPPELMEPWRSFLAALDAQLAAPVSLGCLGGFVLVHLYGAPRTTVDLDTFALHPLDISPLLEEYAGRHSQLHQRFGVYLQHVTIASVPCDAEQRYWPISANSFQYLSLFGLEAHDLALSKLDRFSPTDREDFLHLARHGHVSPDTLLERYHDELRPYLLGDLRTYDFRLNLWLSLAWPDDYPS